MDKQTLGMIEDYIIAKKTMNESFLRIRPWTVFLCVYGDIRSRVATTNLARDNDILRKELGETLGTSQHVPCTHETEHLLLRWSLPPFPSLPNCVL